MTSAPPVLEAHGVRFGYQRSRPVLDGVDLCIHRGAFAAMIGPNGGGKSTLLRLFLGLLEPDAGKLRVLGRSPRTARPRVGYLPQHARTDPAFPMTVRDVVLMGRLGTTPRGDDADAVTESLASVGLAGFERRPFGALSGGERQRVLLARALAPRPEVLLLDEPAAHADTVAEKRFIDLLAVLNDRMTIVVVSHDLGFVTRHVREVVCVNRKVAVHPTQSVGDGVIRELYGTDVAVVRHDQHAPPHEH